MNRRRILLGGAGSVLLHAGWVYAQRLNKPWRIGYLAASPRAETMGPHGSASAFLQGMRDLRLVEGRDFIVEWRFAEGKRDRLHALAAELQRAGVSVIVANSSFSVEAAKAATAEIPIVMTHVGNPIASGFVQSINRPGGRITGLSNISVVISDKYFELLHAAVGKLASVAVLLNPAHPNHPAVFEHVQSAARKMGVTVHRVTAVDSERIPAALDAIFRTGARGLIVPPDPHFTARDRYMGETVLKQRLPTLFGGRPAAVEAGGLIGYDPNRLEIGQRAAALVEKILNGARPADLPVESPTRFDLTLNLKAAKACGLVMPQELLVRAERVIE